MTTLAWVAVADKLRNEIKLGQTGPNGALDTEAELCRRFATSRITVRRALTELRAEGLVTSRRGSGTRAVITSSSPVSVVITAGSDPSEPMTVVRSKVRWRTIRPTAQLHTALKRAGIKKAPKGQWLRLTYEQRLEGTLFDEATLWFPPSTVRYVSRLELATGPTAKLLAQAGLSLGRAIQSVSTEWNERRAQLGDAPSDCIDLTLERVMQTGTGEIAFVSIHRHRSTIVCFRIDLPTSNQEGHSHFVLSAL
jgi:DNA-binding GntR family transcriptional regulator